VRLAQGSHRAESRGGCSATTASLVLAAVLLALGVASSAAQGFSEAPPTWGLARPTAHTLRASELQIGLLSVTDAATFYVNFGLTDNLQIGTWPILALQGAFNVGGKYRFTLTPELEVGIPLHCWYWEAQYRSYELHVGAVASLDLATAVRLHVGLTIVTGRWCDWWRCSPVLTTTPHVISEFRLAETARVLAEVEAAPLKVKTGVLIRVLGAIDLRATLILVPTVELQLGAEGRLLFGRREPGPEARDCVVASLTGCWLFPADAGGEVGRSNKPRDENPQVAESELVQLVEGNSEFALDLFRVLRTEKGNLFFSPYSISMALAMAYAGARGSTATEIAETLHFSLSQDRLHAALNSVSLNLARRAAESQGEFKLTVANSFWGQKGHPFLPDFLDVLAVNYGAGMHSVDFAKAPEACRRAINDWVNEETNGKIKDLLAPGAVSSLTRLVLANAIYLKALWPVPFPKELTAERPFYLLDGREVRVPTMETRLITGYMEGDGYRGATLPLRGDCSMVVLVPAASRYEEFERSLDARTLNRILTSGEPRSVHLFLPKFGYSSEFKMRDVLSALGMGSAFGSAADFSGIDGTRDLWISDVVHKACVGVDELGVEAAGATAILLVGSPPPPPPAELRVDRPFIFILRDSRTGTILFLGRVVNPKEG